MKLILVTWDYDKTPIAAIAVNDDQLDEALTKIEEAYGEGNPHGFNAPLVHTLESLGDGLGTIQAEIEFMEEGEEEDKPNG